MKTTSWAASSHVALISGVRRAARQTALATTSSGETFTSRNSRCSLSLATSFIVRVTSTVIHSVTCGALNAESTIACAIILRTPLIGSRRSRSPVGRAAAAGASAGTSAPVSRTSRMNRARRLDVLAGDRAVRAGRGEAAEVDAEVLGELADRRLGEHPYVSASAGAASCGAGVAGTGGSSASTTSAVSRAP